VELSQHFDADIWGLIIYDYRYYYRFCQAGHYCDAKSITSALIIWDMLLLIYSCFSGSIFVKSHEATALAAPFQLSLEYDAWACML